MEHFSKGTESELLPNVDVVEPSNGTQEENSGKTDIVHISNDGREEDSVKKDEGLRNTDIILDSNPPNVKKLEETTNVEKSNVFVDESQKLQTVASPITICDTESECHTESVEDGQSGSLYMDDDDIEILENMKPSDLLKVYDKVNHIKNFPRYKPKNNQETLLDMVIMSVALMRQMKLSNNLPPEEVREIEDLITAIQKDESMEQCFTGEPAISAVITGEAADSGKSLKEMASNISPHKNITQSLLPSTHVQSESSPQKYIGYDPSLHAYHEQFYTGYDVQPPSKNTWQALNPETHVQMYMGRDPVQKYFHTTVYPPERYYYDQRQKSDNSQLPKPQESNLTGVSQSKAALESTSKGMITEQSTDPYSDNAGYATSDCEADTESLVGECDNLLELTTTSVVKENLTSGEQPASDNVPGSKKRNYEVNTSSYQL